MTGYRRFFLIACLILSVSVPAAAQADAGVARLERIVVIGDVHGDFQQLVNILQLAGLIDAGGEWIGGDTQLVQMGDLPDRGDSTLKVIRFLQELEKDAKKHSGMVHVLIGNHDAMNVYGDLRYVTRQEYAEFEVPQSMDRLRKLYEDEIAWIKKNRPQEQWPEFDDSYRENWFKNHPPGYFEHRINWQADGEIGKWVRSRDAVLRIGKFLFVHGGIGPGYAGFSIDELNRQVRAALKNSRSPEAAILHDEEGPLWYRGLALHPEKDEMAHVDTLLRNYQVEHIFLGHTVTEGVILPRFDGRVVLTDAGISRYYGACSAFVVIENDQMFAQYIDKRIPIPVGEGDSGQLDYLHKVQQLIPENKFINRSIEELTTIPIGVGEQGG